MLQEAITLAHEGDYSLVNDLLVIAQEELEHFEMVHNIIKERGYTLGRECKDSYVIELFKYRMRGGNRKQAFRNARLYEPGSCRMLSRHPDSSDWQGCSEG